MSVIWHDIECGPYTEDLPLWRSLADSHGDPILDIGAGSGRVALDLARHGHRVTALDHDRELISALELRAERLPLDAVLADARKFELKTRFSLCIVPMQTIQLLGGSEERSAFLRCAKAHLRPGGTIAVALAAELEAYEPQEGLPVPLPDVREIDGIVYSSQPIAVREDRDGFVLERRRETVGLDGSHTSEEDKVRLDRLHPSDFERELIAAGFRLRKRAEVPATTEYSGSIVVVADA